MQDVDERFAAFNFGLVQRGFQRRQRCIFDCLREVAQIIDEITIVFGFFENLIN